MIEARVITITPEIAKLYLKENRHNRQLVQSRVAKFAAAMARGEWQINGEPVIVDNRGGLLDGQHRLAAVVEVGKPISMLVVTGVDQGVFTTIDQGKSRTFSDVLHINGEENEKTVAGAARLVRTHLGGTPWSTRVGGHPSTAELLDVLREHPEIRRSVRYLASLGVTNKKNSVVISPVVGATLHYWLSLVSVIDADDFFAALITGEDLNRESPIYALRERLINRNNGSRKMNDRERGAIVTKSWNAWRRSTKLGVLKFNTKGKNKEQYPVAI